MRKNKDWLEFLQFSFILTQHFLVFLQLMSCLLKFLPQHHVSPNYFVTLFSSFAGFFTISNYILVPISPVTMTYLPILRAGISFVWFRTVSPEARTMPSVGRDLTSTCGWSEGLSSGNSSKMGSILVRYPEWSIDWRGQPIMIGAPSLPHLHGSQSYLAASLSHSTPVRMCCVALTFLFTYKFLL